MKSESQSSPALQRFGYVRQTSVCRKLDEPGTYDKLKFVGHKILISVLLASAICLSANLARSQSSQLQLLIKVLDENGVAVADARIVLVQRATKTVLPGTTDEAGRHQFQLPNSGVYDLSIEKEGFYVSKRDAVRASDISSLEITLYHQQEVSESVNVYASPPAIDPEKTALSETVTNREILTVPYPSTRDFRKVLPFIPGVVADFRDQIHVGGSATYQVLDQLDGFNITHPLSGLLQMRVSPDALRAIDVQSSRSSSQYGKGSGGMLSLTTGMGDDHYRFSATNFIPSFQNTRGLNFNDWTPRATFSGPVVRGKAWFFEGIGGLYNLHIVSELPEGADRGSSWRIDNLLKGQINLTERNILTATFLLNRAHSNHEGLSPFAPLETTTDLSESAYLVAVKDQFYTHSGALLETGFAVNQFHLDEAPLNDLPYRISPGLASGSFFKTTDVTARRLQWIENLTLPSIEWHGSHELKFGIDLDRITSDQTAVRRPIFILTESGVLAREITFLGGSTIQRDNFETGAYGQDRWFVSKRLMVEAGLRFDRDTVVNRNAISPRVAATYLLSRDGQTKLSAGVGLYYDATNLELITRPQAGQRLDQFYTDGTPIGPPLAMSFRVDEQNLRVPRYVNWSVGVEHELPFKIYADVEFMQKRGHDVLAFFNDQPLGPSLTDFELLNNGKESYDSVQVTVRRAFKGDYLVLASYKHSRAETNAVLDPSIDDPVFGPQAGGPLPWDVPNHFISWGWMPLVEKLEFAYSLDWRSGFPFSVVNQGQQLVGSPNSYRFPTYFTLNTHLERRFNVWGYYVALRAGVNNITGRQNPSFVNNNIDSPEFLTFAGAQHRSFTGRIRFLGRK